MPQPEQGAEPSPAHATAWPAVWAEWVAAVSLMPWAIWGEFLAPTTPVADDADYDSVA